MDRFPKIQIAQNNTNLKSKSVQPLSGVRRIVRE